MADSGTYDQATLLRRAKIAEAMMSDPKKPITHWAEGLNELAKGLVGGYQESKLNAEAKQSKFSDDSALAAQLGLPAPSAPSSDSSGAAKVASALGWDFPGNSSPPVSSAAAPAQTPAALINAPASPAANPTSSGFAGAISNIESGGKYDALGPVTKTGDRAFGKYQVMASNIPEWTQAALGKSLTPQEFLASPQAQDAVFNHRFGQYAQKYGPEGAARAWFAGEGGMNDPNRKDQLGTSVAQYGQKFMQGLGGKDAVAQALSGTTPQPNAVATALGSDPGTLPSNAAPAQGFAIPGQQQGGAPDVATALSSQPSVMGALSGATPQQKAMIAAGLKASAGSPARALAMSTAQAIIKQQTQQSDPLRQLQMEALRAKIAKDQGKSGTTEYGLNPIYGTDEQGNAVLGTMGKDGTFKRVDTGGVKVSTGVDKVDLGTQIAIYDRKSGQLIGYQPKDLKGAEAQKALGKAQGGMQASLPSDIANAESTISQIDELSKHPGLDSIVGPIDQFRPNWTMSDKGRDALARYNQLKGKAFLQAYSTLRGGGQITEVEGAKAENAMARMDRSQSEAEFKSALKDFRDAVQNGMDKLREKAGVAAPAVPAKKPVSIGGYTIEQVD